MRKELLSGAQPRGRWDSRCPLPQRGAVALMFPMRPKTLTSHVCLLPAFFLTASSLRIYRSRVSPLTARRWEALGAPRFVSAAPDAT